jgi:RNA polymerase sigma-70 factor, ECF subfamily
VIKAMAPGQLRGTTSLPQDILTLSPSSDADLPKGMSTSQARAARLRDLVDAHFDAIWRFMRRLGVASMDLEDAAQEVLVITARTLDELAPSSERSFLFGTAFRVASRWRRFRAGRREVHLDDVDDPEDSIPTTDVLLDQARARALVDSIIESMPLDLRVAFTLFEIEDLTMAELAHVLGVPPGTVASRLRRARELFESRVARVKRKER